MFTIWHRGKKTEGRWRRVCAVGSERIARQFVAGPQARGEDWAYTPEGERPDGGD